MNPWEMPVPLERHTLERRKIGAVVRSSMRVDVRRDVVREELEHRLTAYVLADHLADDTFTGRATLEWPETTWQMFKHRHASSWWLGWLVRRRPVRKVAVTKHVEIQVERYLGYPEANLRMPELGRPVIMETVRQVDPAPSLGRGSAGEGA